MKIIAELHTHSEEYCDHASDTIEQFAKVAKDLGYKYYAATNHSPLNDFISPSSFYVDTIGKKFDNNTNINSRTIQNTLQLTCTVEYYAVIKNTGVPLHMAS